jgi:hypothetical protein
MIGIAIVEFHDERDLLCTELMMSLNLYLHAQAKHYTFEPSIIAKNEIVVADFIKRQQAILDKALAKELPTQILRETIKNLNRYRNNIMFETLEYDEALGLLELEIEKAKKIGDAITRRYEREKEAATETAEIKKESLDNEKTQLDAILAIEDARNNLINARQNLVTSRGDLEIARLERARDIVKQLTEDENLSDVQRLGLRRELGALGIQYATSELSLTQQIATIELANAKRKEESAKLQGEQALKRLEIETKIAELAAKQATLSAKEKVLKSEDELQKTLKDPDATAREKANAEERLRLAKEGLELAKKGQKEINQLKLDELRIQQQINDEQRRQDEIFRQLNRQREIAAGRTDQGRNQIIPLSQPRQSQQPNSDPALNGLNDLQKVLKSIDSKLSRTPQEVNVTTFTGIDGKQIGRDVAKQLRELNNAVFK